jgi:3-oxoadipate enol-lactonase
VSLDAELYVEQHGSGRPLLLVHGLGGTGAAVWKHLIGPLAREFRVVVYDLRGSGKSALVPGPATIREHVGDLQALVERRGLDGVLLMGHSLGGSIVLGYAAAQPERVVSAVSVAGPAEFGDETRAALRARADTVEAGTMAAIARTVATNGMAPAFREAHPEALEGYVELLEGNDVAGYAAQCRGLAELDLGDDLQRIEAPVLLVGGELDGVAPPAAMQGIAARIPRCELRLLEGCGHIIPWEKPDELLGLAHPFLAGAT